MAKTERGPEPRDAFDYNVGWTKIRKFDPFFRTLFPHGIGGKKILVDPKSRPERVRINKEELLHQQNNTRIAEGKYKYLSSIKPEELLDPDWVMRAISRQRLRGLKENITQNINSKDNKNMNNSNKLFQKLFNKFLIEEKHKPTPNILPDGVDPEVENAPLTVVLDPDTGGPGFWNPVAPTSTLSDIAGNIVPAIAAEVALGVLTKGRSVRAMRAREAAMKRHVNRALKSKNYNLKHAYEGIDQTVDGINRGNLRRIDLPLPPVTAKHPWVISEKNKALKQAEEQYKSTIQKAAKNVSRIDFENIGKFQKSMKAAEIVTGLAPTVLTLGYALNQSAKARRDLPPGLYDTDSWVDDIAYPLLAAASARYIAQAVRGGLPVGGRHFARRKIKQEQKRLANNHYTSTAERDAMTELYKSTNSTPGWARGKGGYPATDESSAVVYKLNPNYGEKAWKSPKQSSSAIIAKTAGEAAQSWIDKFNPKKLWQSTVPKVKPLVGIDSFDPGRATGLKLALPLLGSLVARDAFLAANKQSSSLQSGDHPYRTGGENPQDFIPVTDAYPAKQHWLGTGKGADTAGRPLNVIAVVKPPVPLTSEITNMLRGGLRYAPTARRNQAIEFYKTRGQPGGSSEWPEYKKNLLPEVLARIQHYKLDANDL